MSKKKKGDFNMLPVTKDQDEYYESGFPKKIHRGKHDMKINERLKTIRNKRGYSMAKVKELLATNGVKTGITTIQGYEADEKNVNHRYPSLYMLLQLAKVYQCSIDYIFGLTNEVNQPGNDLLKQIHQSEQILWNDKVIGETEKQMIVKKIQAIMDL